MYEIVSNTNVSNMRVNQSIEATARRLYEKATGGPFAGLIKLIGRKRADSLFTLDEVMRQVPIQGQRYLGETEVDLDQIVGTVSEGRSRDFDFDFRPLQRHAKERWLGVAAARISGRRLGRVMLVQVGDIYFVQDGHHRISVARALGEASIEAEVIQLLGTGELTRPVSSETPGFAGAPSMRPAIA